MRLQLTPVVEAKINGHKFICLVDTGASISLLSKGKWESCFSDQQSVAAEIVADCRDCNKHTNGDSRKNYPCCPSRGGGKEKEHELYVVENVGSEVILGLDWMLEMKVTVDFNEQLSKLTDGTTEPMLLQVMGLQNRMVVVLQEDVEVPGRHEVIRRALFLKSLCFRVHFGAKL